MKRKLVVHLNGPEGNAFWIMGMAKQLMKKDGCSKEQIDEYFKDAMSSDYNHLLEATKKVVNLVLV